VPTHRPVVGSVDAYRNCLKSEQLKEPFDLTPFITSQARRKRVYRSRGRSCWNLCYRRSHCGSGPICRIRTLPVSYARAPCGWHGNASQKWSPRRL